MSPSITVVTDLLQQYTNSTTQAPHGSWLRVRVGDVPCGWVTKEITATLQQAGLYTPDASAREVRLPDHDQGLLQVARTLLDAGHLNGWRDEDLDVLDANDQALARIERAAMRPLGLRTRAVHLQATAPDGRLWVAKRADHKTTDPGMWDTLVGGLIGAGEDPHLALLRESAEEAGLEPWHLETATPLVRFDVQRKVPEGYQHETTLVWECELPAACEPRNCDGEVSEIALYSAAEVLEQIGAGYFTAEAALSILHWMRARHGTPPLQRGAGFAAQG